MNATTAARKRNDVPHEHRGDLYRPGEAPSETADRIRAHLRVACSGMEVMTRQIRSLNGNHLSVAIIRYGSADLSDRDARFTARRVLNAELERFTRYDWDPHRGARNVFLSVDTSVDPAAYAAALVDVPQLNPLVSFAEFTRTARPGDLLEHVAGKNLPHDACAMITAVSARRLTTRPADHGEAARQSRVPIQGGACFVSDGDLVCFKHSGFAHQGGYSLVRWVRHSGTGTSAS